MEKKESYESFIGKLTIVFPLYNEERRVTTSLKRIGNFYKNLRAFPKLVFVLDGCTDKTKTKLVDELEKQELSSKSRILEYSPNRGVGYAMHAGLKEVKTDYVLFSDFDISTPLSELRNFFSLLTAYDVIIGSRWLDRERVENSFFRRFLSSTSINIIKIILGINLSDTQCGFKLFKTNIAKEIYAKRHIDRFGVDFEIMFIAKNKGYRIKELPVVWKHEKWSKVGWLDYFRTLLELFRVRWNSLKGAYS